MDLLSPVVWLRITRPAPYTTRYLISVYAEGRKSSNSQGDQKNAANQSLKTLRSIGRSADSVDEK
jgi:hypothetical protein